MTDRQYAQATDSSFCGMLNIRDVNHGAAGKKAKRDIAHFLKEKNFGKLEYVPILERDGLRFKHGPWVRVEPRIPAKRKQSHDNQEDE